MPFEFWYTLIIIILMIVFIIREIVETEIVMFSAVILLSIGNVINIDQAFIGFSDVDFCNGNCDYPSEDLLLLIYC